VDLRLGIVGRGAWGSVYVKALKELRIAHWQDGRYWHMRHADGLIVACSSAAHYEVAKCALGRGIPVLIEKPVTLDSREAWELVEMGGIAFAGHTRLFSPSWRQFKRPARKVVGYAGGVTESNPDAVWNWIPHLAAMALDCDAEEMEFHVTEERQPLRMIVDGAEWVDVNDEPIKVLIREFRQAIEKGIPDNAGLRLGAQVVEITEALRGLFPLEAHEHFHARRIAPGRYSVGREG
jgi:hypothetical protein